MNYIPYQNIKENMLSRMKEEENFLPYIYSFFNFQDSQNNISCALNPLSGKGEQYIMSKEQEETLDSSAAELNVLADYYGDGEYEKYLSSSFNYYLEKYNVPENIRLFLPGAQTYTERASSLVIAMADLLYNYASFKKGKKEKVSRDINSLISMKSYFPSKYCVPVEEKLGEEITLLFSKEKKIRGNRFFCAPHNAALITNNRLEKGDIKTTEILDSLFHHGLVEENAKGLLALTARSELLSMINSYGVIYFRDIRKKGLDNALTSLKAEGAVEEWGFFLSPDETALLEYVLGSGYENSLSLFSYYTTGERNDEDKAERDYLLLLTIMTALTLKVIEEISLIPQTVVKSLTGHKTE